MPPPFGLSALARRGRLVLAAAALAAVPAQVLAGTAEIGVLIDKDNSAATGCTVTTANGTFPGVDLLATTVITTTPTGATVARLERRECVAGALGPAVVYSTGGWNVGIGNGTGGSAVVETSIPLAWLRAGGTARALVTASNGAGGLDATAPFNFTLAASSGAIAVPLSPGLAVAIAVAILALTAWLRRRHPGQFGLLAVFLVISATGLAWAATVIRDGNIGDWTGVSASVTDAAGDGAPNADIVAVFLQDDGTDLFLRIDADIRADTGNNAAPVVNAGASQTITLPAAANLSGSATDDGLPNPPGTLTYAWSRVSGPGTVTFGNASQPATTATFSAAGTHVLRLTANDGALTGQANVTITVNAASGPNQAPTVNAGANQAITLPAGAVLAGSATDDGLPNPPGALTFAWTRVSGPGTVTFGNAALAATTATFSAAGTHVLRLTASDGALTGQADVTITVNVSTGLNQPPTVSAGADQAITLPATATLAGIATDDGLPNPPGILTTTWSLVSGPVGSVSLANAASPATTASFSAPGVYTLRLAADDGALSASGTVQVTVIDGPPQLAAVADFSVEAGNRVQVVLEGRDGNGLDRLTYSLDAAPSGAMLNPAPLFDWVPTSGQLGSHTVTARVTDTGGRFATTTFRVTVIQSNRAPRLAPQEDAIVVAGTPFSRRLAATDDDAGDALAFALVSGPAGMALSGADLGWPTAAASPGDYPVTVRVTDRAGLTDQKSFTVTVRAAASPLATDDRYEVRVGQSLTVPAAAGVLANDTDPLGGMLTATRLTDPAKGTLNAFNPDGGFTYTAPASVAATPPLNPRVAWRGFSPNTSFPVAADLDGDGIVDYVTNDFGRIRAWKGSDGTPLWQFDRSVTTNVDVSGCVFQAGGAPSLARVSGNDTYLFMGASCPTGAPSGAEERIVAINASRISPTGTVAAQWVSPIFSKPHPGAHLNPNDAAPPATPIYPFTNAAAFTTSRALLTTARLTPTGAPKLLFQALVINFYGQYYSGGGAVSYAACRAFTGLAADEGRPCKLTFVLDAATGALDQVLSTDNADNELRIANDYPSVQNAPIVADLDGDGQVEIVSGGDVFRLVNGSWTLAWRALFPANAAPLQRPFEPNTVAVADLDGDGRAEVLHWIVNIGGAKSADINGIHIFRHDGTLLRKIPLISYYNGFLSVADVDGDGAPEIVFTADSFVHAFRPDGSLLWSKLLPDILSGPDIIPTPALGPLGGTRTTDGPVQVYDLDLDGRPEVIVQGMRRLFILDGRTGAERYSVDTESGGLYAHANVMLVDADNDGHVDIVVSGSNRWNCSVGGGPVACLGSQLMISGADLNWAPGPKIHNQMSYRPGAVDGAGRILYDASVRRDFRQQVQQGTVVDPRIAQSDTFTYRANNAISGSAPAQVEIAIAPLNRPPVITSTPPTSQLGVSPYPTRIYTITAVDPDPGDTVRYELVATTHPFMSSFAAVTVNATTGDVDVYSGPCGSFGGPCNFGLILVVVAAVDSQGARTEQSFFIDSSSFGAAVPNVIGTLLPNATTAIESAGLKARVVTESFGPQPAGTVIGQDPAGGAANIARSATVRLTVSKGPQPVAMPFVVGQRLPAATALLASLGLSAAPTAVFSSTIPAGEVIAQSPASGTLLQPATAPPAALTVSAGGPLAFPVSQIVVEPGPSVRAAGDTLQYRATAVLSNGTSADVTYTAAWSSTASGVASIDSAGTARAVAAGSTTISATLSGVSGSATLGVLARVGADGVPPTAAITSPADGAAVTGPVPVVGSAADANFLRYELAYAPAGSDAWTTIAEGTSAVTGASLGTFDPTTLLNDLYTLRLRVFDRNGNEAAATTTVQVRGDRKLGVFSVAYQDLNVPAAGVPLTITRTYDSRDKQPGDFGVGWRLSLQTLRIRTNRVPGTGWVRNVSGPTVSLVPTSEHKVALILPDGQVEEFDLVVSPTSNLGSLDATNVTGYVPRAGTLGQLEALANPGLLVISAGAEVELVDDTTLNTYEPALYRYTSAEGVRFEISPVGGVKKVTDRNGNVVTFGPGGILHSNGTGIVFSRDPQGRIVVITDPAGNVQTYAYDGNGDLVRHANAVGGVSTYAYDRSHGLIDIRDAAGTQSVRNEYDAQGRLTAMVDAAGRRIAFTRNPAANEEVVTDRRGGQARFVYDGNGNVLTSERAVTIEGVLTNAVTTRTYDALDNVTQTIDPDGRRQAATYSGKLLTAEATDPGGLNLRNTYAYNARNDVSNAADALGRPFTFTYDGNGNLTGATTPVTGATTAQANAQGQPTRLVDAAGNATVLTRDAAGLVIREDRLDASATLLRRIDFTWDANGNKASETLYRAVGGTLTPQTTRFAYDAANRLVRVTDPLGAVTSTEYDAAGRVTATVDPLGRRTTLAYDSLGRRVRTTFPDGTFASVSYDNNGNAASETDAAGRTTTYAYDELDRRVRVTRPDGAFTQTVYTPGGLVAAEIDALGNRTDFTYDTAGRLTSRQLPAVANGPGGPLARPTVSYTLDPLGGPTRIVEPNGRATTMGYDASGRLALTTYPDGSSVAQAYDALGRLARITNESGEATNFAYDGLGRLTAVSGLAGDATYAYDEAGHLVAQTDALGRVTRLAYDAAGRRISRQYPGGETETFAYDAAGNLVASTDANGRTTTYVHDAMDRLVRTNLPGGSVIRYAYAADGNRASVTDARGVTSYSYDGVGRLAGITHPGGEALGYTRDAAGNLVTLAAPAGSTSYGYDALNRLVRFTTPEGTGTQAYDLAGNRVQRTLANGIRTDYAYDLRNRLSQVVHRTGGGATIASFAATYSPAGRRTQLTEGDGSVVAYTYDSRGRLAAETRTGSQPYAITYAYDAVGNRTQKTSAAGTATYTYDANDRLLSDGTATYAWDANGNLASRTSGGTTVQYGYDSQDRLVAVQGGGTAVQYAYDADGNRVQASTAGGVTRFLVDRANATGLSQVLEERDGNGALKARHAYGRELLALARMTGTRHVLADTQGNTRRLADDSAALTDSYLYNAYGEPIAATGTTDNPYRYGGQRFDAESGFYSLRARYYDPARGRFLTRDPFEGEPHFPVSRHRYLYADADPANRADPTGLLSIEVIVSQYINSVIDTASFVRTVNQACTVYTTTEQVQDLVFATSALAHSVLAFAGAQAAIAAATNGSASFAGGADITLLSLENSKAKPNSIKKLGATLFTSRGRIGVKASIEAAGSGTIDKGSNTFEFQVSGPPLNVSGAAGGKVRAFEKKYDACGIEYGKVTSDLTLKGSVGNGAAGNGVGAELGLKFELFNGAFSFGLPLLGAGYNTRGSADAYGTIGVTILGVQMGFPLR